MVRSVPAKLGHVSNHARHPMLPYSYPASSRLIPFGPAERGIRMTFETVGLAANRPLPLAAVRRARAATHRHPSRQSRAGSVGARLKCHRLRKVKMTFGGSGGLTRLQLRPEPCAMAGPLSAYPVPPGCLAAAGVVDRPAYGLVDTTLAARARTPVPRPAAYSRRSRRAPLSGSCRTPGTAVRHLGVGQRS